MACKTVRAEAAAGPCRAVALAVALSLLLAAGCAPPPERSRPAAAPAPPAAVPKRVEEIIVVDFAEAAPVPDLAFGRKIADDLAAAMRDAFKGTVSRRPGFPAPDAPVLEPGFWRSAGVAAPPAVFLFGTAALTEQAQKALLEADLPKDGPFKLEGHGLAERKRFVLTMDLALIDAASGEVIWKTQLKETRVSPYIVETPEFGLIELLPTVRARLLPMLFGPR